MQIYHCESLIGATTHTLFWPHLLKAFFGFQKCRKSRQLLRPPVPRGSPHRASNSASIDFGETLVVCDRQMQGRWLLGRTEAAKRTLFSSKKFPVCSFFAHQSLCKPRLWRGRLLEESVLSTTSNFLRHLHRSHPQPFHATFSHQQHFTRTTFDFLLSPLQHLFLLPHVHAAHARHQLRQYNIYTRNYTNATPWNPHYPQQSIKPYVIKEARHCDCLGECGGNGAICVQGMEPSRSETTLESRSNKSSKLTHKHRDRVRSPLDQMKEHWVATEPTFAEADAVIWASTKASNKSGHERSMTGTDHKGSNWPTAIIQDLGLHDEACRPAPQGATGQGATPSGRLQGKGNELLLARPPRHSSVRTIKTSLVA